MTLVRRLGKNYIIYALAGILSNGINFLFIPFYTRIFSPSEYGSLEMLTVLTNFLNVILVMGMDSAQSIYFFKYEKDGLEKQSHLVSSILQWKIILGLTAIFLTTFISPLLNNIFFDGELNLIYFLVAFSSALFLQVMTQCAELTRLIFKPWDYLKINLIYSIICGIFVIIFVVNFVLAYFK